VQGGWNGGSAGGETTWGLTACDPWWCGVVWCASCQHVAETVVTASGRRLDAVKRKFSHGANLGVSKLPPPVWAEEK
jgi:hypothetical protein